MSKLAILDKEIEGVSNENIVHHELAESYTYKVMIADDDQDIHDVTKMILGNFAFEGHKVEFIDTYSGKETIEYLSENRDVAVLFLDVVMEDSHAGFDVVKAIRHDMANEMLRIILRTGQPGEAPEASVIRDYDINDYRLKTEFTARRLKTTMYSSIRNYRDLLRLKRNEIGLEKIIKASANLFEHNSLDDFLVSMLNELSNFHIDNSDMLHSKDQVQRLDSGLITIEEKSSNKIVAATGKYKSLVGLAIENVVELNHLTRWMNNKMKADALIHRIDSGFIIESRGKSHLKNFIYVDGPKDDFDYELIHIFISNFSIALDNYILNNMINLTQKEIIFALGETVESHFEETGSHIKRISEMMYHFALCTHQSYSESEMLKLASTMHDLGKVAIRDVILKKPGRLTAEEFNEMKTHTNYGYKILSKSDLPVMKLAAEIALNHHEKYDGSGYPQGKSGLDIPMCARMMAIVDVYDAMTHKRCYKDAIPIDETINELISQKGKHFDGRLLDLFLDNIEEITASSQKLES